MARLEAATTALPPPSPPAATSTGVIVEVTLSDHELGGARQLHLCVGGGLTLRGFLADIDTEGLGGALLIGEADERAFTAICIEAALCRCRDFIERHPDVVLRSERAIDEHGQRGLLERTLLPWFRHSLEASGRYVPMASMLLERHALQAASTTDSWACGLGGGLLPGPFANAVRSCVPQSAHQLPRVTSCFFCARPRARSVDV
jgi:hypothetical protein